ncbi:hypothetical protein ZIOFF_013400 [Zingiber officinale]|uniref:WRKY19-like zinc finger domain-containing protein n=1 Tax=Zingiber officinale TaxID=94328 RepID=A0A8J5HLB4_ZINOF|nr:hypothetical protein ZIOFF_013400 [Zingiber officinale]
MHLPELDSRRPLSVRLLVSAAVRESNSEKSKREWEDKINKKEEERNPRNLRFLVLWYPRIDGRHGHFGLSLNFSSRNDFKDLAQYHTDTSLWIGSSHSSLDALKLKGTKRKFCDVYDSGIEASSLTLGLGRPVSSSDSSKKSSATACTMSSARETDEGSSMDLGLNFDLNLGNENIVSSKKPSPDVPKAKVDLQLSLSIGGSNSIVTSVTPVSTDNYILEGSTSSLQCGNRLLPYLGSNSKHDIIFPDKAFSNASTQAGPSDASLSVIIQPQKSSDATSKLTQTQQRYSNTKNCQFLGCSKGARGASGLCIAHGGGRRCQKAGCQKGAEGRTIFCKAHGGGKRCQHLGCTKSAEGRTDYCIAHGGGRRCSHEGCPKAARGKSGRCIRHGGGKRCQKEYCTKSAEGHSGLCIAHGGGRRCQYPECTKGAQGGTHFCKAHGGGKRCSYLGCTKGAEGSTLFCKAHGGGKRCAFQGGCTKSVHGGTQFCVAHGGGKRCAVSECTKSARGRTDFCVRHGGGKRCKVEGCGKSAQGSTEFCKAHGGGKRCSWGQPESGLGISGPPCERLARGKSGLCTAHTALVDDQCVHGEGQLLAFSSENQGITKPEKMKEIVDLDRYVEKENGKNLILSWGPNNAKEHVHSVTSLSSRVVSLPEGRVHGGSLMAMLASNSSNGSTSTTPVDSSNSTLGIPYLVAIHCGIWISDLVIAKPGSSSTLAEKFL